jgi:hypothetical protein
MKTLILVSLFLLGGINEISAYENAPRPRKHHVHHPRHIKNPKHAIVVHCGAQHNRRR